MDNGEKLKVKLTSRYDGHPPSWLRGCLKCQAMGKYPVKAHAKGDREAGAPENIAYLITGQHSLSQDLNNYEVGAVFDLIAEGKREDDGWYLIQCPQCQGSGRVSWLRTICRAPRWLWRGIPFIWNTRHFNSDVSLWANCWVAFKCAYLVDLGLWHP